MLRERLEVGGDFNVKRTLAEKRVDASTGMEQQHMVVELGIRKHERVCRCRRVGGIHAR